MKKLKKLWINFWGHRYRVYRKDELVKEILIYHRKIYEMEDFKNEK